MAARANPQQIVEVHPFANHHLQIVEASTKNTITPFCVVGGFEFPVAALLFFVGNNALERLT